MCFCANADIYCVNNICLPTEDKHEDPTEHAAVLIELGATLVFTFAMFEEVQRPLWAS